MDLDRVNLMLNRVVEVREPELVLLHGHFLAERLLVEIVAQRLNSTDKEVPRVSISTLVQLAFVDDEQKKPVLWLNDLRNALAHEFDAFETKRFTDLVRCFDFEWPRGNLERAAVLQLIVYDALKTLLDRYVDLVGVDGYLALRGEGEEPEKLWLWSRAIEKALAAARDLARNNEWNELLGEIKPGWRGKLNPSA
jgi:hypothetical protein